MLPQFTSLCVNMKSNTLPFPWICLYSYNKGSSRMPRNSQKTNLLCWTGREKRRNGNISNNCLITKAVPSNGLWKLKCTHVAAKIILGRYQSIYMQTNGG